MLSLLGNAQRYCDGVSRRSFLSIGALAAGGLTLPQLLRAESESRRGRSHKAVIMVFLSGGPPHQDMFDLKPDAPVEIRGEFKPIATAIPGYSICEHLPQLAARANKYAVIRTLSHEDNNHLMSTHHVLTGEKQPGGFFDKVASRDDWPCYSGALAFLRQRDDGLPSGVNLPTFLREGPLTWPGQHAGFLGANYDPWQITGDPNKPDFRVDALTLAAGILPFCTFYAITSFLLGQTLGVCLFVVAAYGFTVMAMLVPAVSEFDTRRKSHV